MIQLAFLYFLPESPRWLIANDRLETARQVLSQYHAGTTEPNELVRWEVEEISAALEAEKDQKSSSYMHFFKTRKFNLFYTDDIDILNVPQLATDTD